MWAFTTDGINDARTCALIRAWQRRRGKVDGRTEQAVRDAIARIDRQETTLEMEVQRIERRPKLW